MRRSTLRNRVSAAAIAAMSLIAAPTFAQTAQTAPAADETAVDELDAIVVTASVSDKSKINSSVSVTTVDAKSSTISTPAPKPKCSA